MTSSYHSNTKSSSLISVKMRELLYSSLSNHLACILLGAPILQGLHTTLILSIVLAVVLGVDPETVYYDIREGVMGMGDVGPSSESPSSADVRSTGGCRKVEPTSSTTSSSHTNRGRYNPKGRLLRPVHRIAIVLAILVGSFAAPLDWDVWWQQWPIPSACLGLGVAILCCIHIAVQ